MKKKFIIFLSNDAGGCGFYRVGSFVNEYQTYVDSEYDIIRTKLCITDLSILKDTYSIILQRFAGSELIEYLKFIKELRKQGKTSAKIFGELDDCFSAIESYNKASEVIKTKDVKLLDETYLECDSYRVSTFELARYVEKRYHKKAYVVKNAIERYMMYIEPPKYTCRDIPLILYTGAANHFNETDHGDFTGWVEPLIEAVKADKMVLGFFGGAPWFFEEIKDKCMVFPFQKSSVFLPFIRKINADFIIAPLKNNYFNKCKSDVKLIESYAVGSVFIGSMWDRSPYECGLQYSKTPAQHIEEILELSNTPTAFESRIKQQREYLINNNRYIKFPEIEF